MTHPPVTPDPPVLDRRSFGTAMLTACGGTVVMATLGGCTPEKPDPVVDGLRALAEAARRDARQLGAADDRLGTDAERLRRVGGVRQLHADALEAEVRRLVPEGPTTTEQATDTPTDDGPADCPPAEEVRRRLRRDIDAAVAFAAVNTGFRAALVASVAASCRAALEVTLA